MKITADAARKRDQKREEARAARAEAFRREADPLLGKAMRGEIDMSEYRAKVDEIRARHPYPEEQ